MTDANPLFVDTNILIYANVQESPFHRQAFSALAAAHEEDRPLWISRQILREYMAVMTRPDMVNKSGKGLVLSQIEQFTDQFDVADEISDVTVLLLALIEEHRISGKQIHDANIVATMQAYGIQNLLTANLSDFKRFESIITIEGLSNS